MYVLWLLDAVLVNMQRCASTARVCCDSIVTLKWILFELNVCHRPGTSIVIRKVTKQCLHLQVLEARPELASYTFFGSNYTVMHHASGKQA